MTDSTSDRTPDPQDTPTTQAEATEGMRRRTFLQATGAAAAMTALEARTSTRVAYGVPGGHTLVVVSLRGGFDGLSAVAPVNDPAYQQARPHIAVPASRAVQLDGTFGLHPAMAPLEQLWRDGHLAVVHAVGQPQPSRSHFTAMVRLDTAELGASSRTGWMDRLVGQVNHEAPFAAIQLGSSSIQYGMTGPMPEVVTTHLSSMYFDFAERPDELPVWARTLQSLYARSSGVSNSNQRNAFPVTCAGACASVAEAQRVMGAFPIQGDRNYDASRFGTQEQKGYTKYTYGEDLANSLQDLARLIKAGSGVRVCSIEVDGWDTHTWMGNVDEGSMKDKLTNLATNLRAFRYDLGDALWQNVTVITLSEFGRRVGQNATGGLDHGNGNVVLMMGGQVAGGRMHGRWPGLGAGQLNDGDIAVTTDYRQLLAEILTKRMGVGNMGAVLPGLSYAPIGVLR